MNRMKAAAEWFRNNVFKDEAIQPRRAQPKERAPLMIRTARSLENGTYQSWQSREAIFLKQGKLLASYEDDYVYEGAVQRYYPTYQALSDQELRGYFSWRTKLRRGEVEKTSLTFAFLYIYELINQIGVEDPREGWRKLLDFQEAYGQLDNSVLPYLRRWLVDYAAYYELPPELLADFPLVVHDRSVMVLEHIKERSGEEVMEAVKQLAPRYLARSKFYGAYPEDMDAATVGVLRRVWDHYARCKKTMVETYFGTLRRDPIRIFEAAVFCDPLRRRDYEYVLDRQCVYRCAKGVWSVERRVLPMNGGGKLEDLLKTIDAVMREEYAYRYPIKAKLDTKWILQAIREEVRGLLEEKRAAEAKKVTIDYAQLSRIRQDAEVTQEKLIVDEEMDIPEEVCAPEEVPAPEAACVPEAWPAGGEDIPLSPPEYRLLQCLLYGGDTGWVQAEGHLLSVLADGVNEKLYDVFQDSVLEDGPRLIEDYINDLKEMVRP